MKLSTALAWVCWASIIALVWFWLFGVFKMDAMTSGAFIFFLGVGFLSSVASSYKGPK